MENFIRNIKNHKKIAVICLSVLLVSIIIVMIVTKFGGGTKINPTVKEHNSDAIGYFEDSDYPVYASQENQTLVIELDGSKSPDLKWENSDSPDNIIAVSDKGEEKDGMLTYVLWPSSTGYATVTFKRSGEIGGFSYDAVNIQVDVIVYTDDENVMYIKISDIRQSTASAGALDSDTPYLLNKNRVIMPNGGDWTLAPADDGGAPEGLYRIMEGVDDSGYSYFDVSKDLSLMINEDGEPDENAVESRLILKSESLGIEKRLDCVMNSEREWLLVEEAKE